MVVKSELEKLGINFSAVELGEVEILGKVTKDQLDNLSAALKVTGLELMDDKKSVLVEKIKTTIIELVHYTDHQNKINLSDYLSEKLNHPYPYLYYLFSEVMGTTIEKYYLCSLSKGFIYNLKFQLNNAFGNPLQGFNIQL